MTVNNGHTVNICNVMWWNHHWETCHTIYKSATSSHISHTSCDSQSSILTHKYTNILRWPLRIPENSDESCLIRLILWFHLGTAHSTFPVLPINTSRWHRQHAECYKPQCGATTVFPWDPPPLSYSSHENILITLAPQLAKCLWPKLIFTVSEVHA